jgi:hypothetical protein
MQAHPTHTNRPLGFCQLFSIHHHDLSRSRDESENDYGGTNEHTNRRGSREIISVSFVVYVSYP